MKAELRYFPDTSRTELMALVDVADIVNDDGVVSETKMTTKAVAIWPQHSGGWVSWEPASEDVSVYCPSGGRHRPASRNPRRCVDCNAWPLQS